MMAKTGPDDFLQRGGNVKQLRDTPATDRPFYVHGSGFRTDFGEYTLEATGLSKERDTLYARVNLYRGGRWLMGDEKLNLGSSRTRSTLANQFLTATSEERGWNQILSVFCRAVLERQRLGNPVEYLDAPPKNTKPNFTVSPLVLDDAVTLLYGDGEAGKSFFALYLAFVAQLGLRPIAPLSLGAQCKVLYLDFEWDIEAHRQRCHQLAEGMGIPAPRIAYRSMAGTHFPDDVDRIQDIMAEEGCRFLILDSVAWAVNKPLKDAEAAQELYAALNRLPGAKLAIHHESHEGSGNTNAQAFGSRYFRHGARLSWRLRGSTDDGMRALICSKFNAGPRFKSFAVQFDCGGLGQPARFLSASIEKNPEWLGHASGSSQWNAILSWLVQHQPADVVEIGEGLNLHQETVRRYLVQNSPMDVKKVTLGKRDQPAKWALADYGQ